MTQSHNADANADANAMRGSADAMQADAVICHAMLLVKECGADAEGMQRKLHYNLWVRRLVRAHKKDA